MHQIEIFFHFLEKNMQKKVEQIVYISIILSIVRLIIKNIEGYLLGYPIFNDELNDCFKEEPKMRINLIKFIKVIYIYIR